MLLPKAVTKWHLFSKSGFPCRVEIALIKNMPVVQRPVVGRVGLVEGHKQNERIALLLFKKLTDFCLEEFRLGKFNRQRRGKLMGESAVLLVVRL